MARRASAQRRATKDRKQRVRFGQLPQPPKRIEFPYGQQRPELKDLTEGEQTMLLMETDAFKDQIGRICDRLDKQQGTRGPRRSYTAWECEVVFIYQRVCGLRAVKEARDRLAGDRGADARRLFGFDKPRVVHGKRKRVLRKGIPSDATLSRHLTRFGERRHMAACERMFRQIGMDHMREFPEMREEARLLGMDGSMLKTHYTCPIYAKGDKEKIHPVNAERITCHDGGFVAQDAPPEKQGHGYNGVFLSTLSGLPLVSEIIRAHDPEVEAARKMIKGFKRDYTPLLEKNKLRVMVTDGGFHNHDLRHESQDAGVIQQTHETSHANPEHGERQGRKRYEIEGYPHWHANGHDELECKCGEGHVWKEFSIRDNKPVIGTGGNCPNGERISLTVGGWWKQRDRWVRCQPGEDKPDYAFANPLTYNDKIATVLGRTRWSVGEGLNGQLVSRYQLLKGKRWFRRRDQARTDMAIVFSIMHALAMEQRRRANAAAKAQTSSANGHGPPLVKAA